MQTSTLIIGALALSQIEATPERLTELNCEEDWSAKDTAVGSIGASMSGTWTNSNNAIGAPIQVDYTTAEWYDDQVIYFKVTISNGRKHAFAIYGTNTPWDNSGSLEGGQARTNVGTANTCRWGKAAQTIYKWTPSTNDPNEDMNLQILATGGQTDAMHWLTLQFSGQGTSGVPVVSLSGATTATDGLVEPTNLGCKIPFTTTDITADVGADSSNGDEHEFTCQNSKVASGKAICANGLWNSPTCGTPNAACASDFTTDYITADVGAGTLHGAEVTFTCTNSYLASGKAKCTDGNWNKATCLKPNSPCLEHFYTSDISALVGAGTAHGGSVTFSCAGTKVPSGSATCTNGVWNAPTCDGADPSSQDSASSASLGFLALAASALAFNL